MKIDAFKESLPFLFLDNQIDTCTGLDQSKMPNLLTLEMRENRLITTKGIALPNLKSLYLVNRFSLYSSSRPCVLSRLRITLRN